MQGSLSGQVPVSARHLLPGVQLVAKVHAAMQATGVSALQACVLASCLHICWRQGPQIW